MSNGKLIISKVFFEGSTTSGTLLDVTIIFGIIKGLGLDPEWVPMSMTEFCILNQYCVFDGKNDVKIDYKILKQHAKHDFWKIRGENAMNTK